MLLCFIVEDRNSTLVSFVVEQIKECKAVEDEISQVSVFC